MPKLTIIDNEYASLWFYPEHKIVHHKFHQFIFGQPFRDVLNRGADLLQQHHAQKWLSDDRNNSALRPEDKAWSQTEWFPRVVNAGWKYWALVMPQKIVGQMNMKAIVDDYARQGVVVRVFSDPEKAMQWLVAR